MTFPLCCQPSSVMSSLLEKWANSLPRKPGRCSLNYSTHWSLTELFEVVYVWEWEGCFNQ